MLSFRIVRTAKINCPKCFIFCTANPREKCSKMIFSQKMFEKIGKCSNFFDFPKKNRYALTALATSSLLRISAFVTLAYFVATAAGLFLLTVFVHVCVFLG